MYDLIPPNMKAQFNLISKPNQSIKLSVEIIAKMLPNEDLLDYKYNNKLNATIEFNNILNVKKEIWRDYKDIGFSAVIMLTWSF